MSSRVVRRRKKDDLDGGADETETAADAAAAPVARGRRAAVEATLPEPVQVVVEASVAAPIATEPPDVAAAPAPEAPQVPAAPAPPQVVVEAAPVPVAAPVPPAKAEPPAVEAPAVEAPAVEAPAVEAPVRVPEVPVAAAPVEVTAPVEAPAPPTAAARPAAARPAAARPAAPPRERQPAREKAPEKSPERAASPERGVLPETPRFQGYGKAVVALPPGYDPSNPRGNRVAQETAGRRTPAAPAGPAGPAAPAAPRGRRQAETVGQGDDRRNARRGRGKRATTPVALTKPPRSLKKGVGGGSTVAPKAAKRKVRVDNLISVSQLSHELGLKAPVILKVLMKMGMMVKVNDMLDVETAAVVASEFDYEVENVGFQEDKFLQHVSVVEEEDNRVPRAPIVTIMGHVDHGKTTLLDAIRDANVAKGEAGGITQHIGAYQVDHEGQTITFIDTPGHAAFTSMRARGAQATDIVILVVAADDGVQPQTEEAIAHAKAAGVPIIVAVNKMDKPGVKSDPIKQRLSERGLLAEDWGGETQFCEISALKRLGIEDILEAILLQAEILDLTANEDRHAEGLVIESQMERGRGAVATVLVQNGTLKLGDHVVIGTTYGKVRAMTDFRGKRLKVAGPSVPVSIVGLGELPDAGDVMAVVENEKNARTLVDHRTQQKRDEAFGPAKRRTMEDIFAAAGQEERVTLNVLIKADVNGSLEAVRAAVQGLQVDGTEIRILHAGVGNISESDVTLVGANDAMLVGFNVRVDAKARTACDRFGIEPQLYSVIYTLLDDVRRRLVSLLDPDLEEVRHGSAEVRAIFVISKVGTIAGCFVKDGKIGRNHTARVLRGGRQVWEGRIATLKRFKDDVREVADGYECGVRFEGFNDLQEGDIFETYTMEEVTTA
ncbi:MAG: translation initiation factor IF-2 [Deltaproteobacteria bacterium]|nr:translation initiation factor IF-2 [Deltaproteobacteria bacterium]